MAGLLVSVDVEASGPCPRYGDMISFGAVVIEPTFSWQFYSDIMRPECENFEQEAYDSIGMTREEHDYKHNPSISNSINRFSSWCGQLKQASQADRLIMVSDNPGFDFQWMNYECWDKIGYNPFGHTARKIGDVWSGLRTRHYETAGWKRYRRTKHTHNALDDALGNAEAWLDMWLTYGGREIHKEIEKLRVRFQQISDEHKPRCREILDIPDSLDNSIGLGDNWPRL